MLERLFGAIRQQAARFVSDKQGSVLPVFTLALVPILAMVGSAVDYSRAGSLRQGLQAALDAAVLAGARDGTSNWSNVARDTFNNNIPANALSSLSGLSPSFSVSDNGNFSGTASASARTNFMGIMGISAVPLFAKSVAALRTGTGTSGQFCVLALNMNASPSLTLNGNASINLTASQCTLQVNSNSSQAVSLNGNTSIASRDNCFVGGVTKVGNATLSPAPDKMCKPMPDPFVSYSKPTVGACDHDNYSASGNQSITLQPGVYCGGMSFSGQVSVTFAPGLYVIKDGVLNESGGTSFTGNGVSFFLTGQGASVQMSGQADWHLTAPTSGPLASFVFFLDPSGPSGLAATSSSLAGQAELYFEGVVYFPKQLLTITGNSEVQATAPYSAFIADTITINGNGQLVLNSDPNATPVPIPSALQVTWNGQPRLVQ
jgi:Flp pilus assembly protein TadG